MSDTTGWEKQCDGEDSYIYAKVIDGFLWHVWNHKKHKCWHLAFGETDTCRATRPTLRECQILAHATARLWAGEQE